MSRSFAGTPFSNYRGPSVFPVQDTQLCMPATMPSRIVSLAIDWSAYGAPAVPSIGVEVVLPQQASDKLGKVAALYIDNTNSNIPIYINFPDTGFTITAPPATSVWYPVFTNVFRFQVIALNMVAGFVPNTKIFISNREIGPSVDNEFFNVVPQFIGSTLIQRSNTVGSGFGAPALGDQCKCVHSNTITANVFGNVALQYPTVTTIVLPTTTPATDFYYITACELILMEFSAVCTVAAAFLHLIGNFGDQNSATPLLRFGAVIGGAGTTPFALNTPLIRLTGMNLRVPGNVTYGLIQGDFNGGSTVAPVVITAGVITSIRFRIVMNLVYSQGP